MPRGGHNRLPTEVKRQRGTLEKHRETSGTPAVEPSKVPDPPARMKKSERDVWAELAAQVEHLGVYSASNYSGFKLLVRTVWMAEQADDHMPDTARVRLVQAANSALCAFGLTPASRGRVVVPVRAKTDDVEEDLFGGGLQVVKGGKSA